MALRALNLSKTYNKKTVVRDVTIEVNRGEAVALLGPNGAGKTTCFSMISGLVKIDSGFLYLDDQEITNLPIYKRSKYGIGYLPQESSIFRGLNVEDNIYAILEFIEKDTEVAKKRLEELLGDFSISHLKYADSSNLSGGERRRVEIARALAINPKFILLDEPLAGIDPIAVDDIKKLIKGLKEKKIGILITDHNVRETLGIIDRGYVIYNGKIIFSGTPKEILKSDIVKQVYLGDNFNI
ncbi:MAG: LPS export ABC transporter ATP-binding protein [Alphaproteobacteria bacterium]|nr:LPS export ABC transporter ATP-binding protein [Alphaproteobacteria bacterium]